MGSKGKGKGGGLKKFQIELGKEWKDYGDEEDAILKRAFLVGQPNCKFSLRGQSYLYDFKKFVQKNLASGKERKLRAPPRMTPPKDPLLPPGPMVLVTVPPGGVRSVDIADPNNPGKNITVAIPPMAKQGSKIAVPVPAPGESVEEVVKKQQGWSTGGKVAAGAAAVGALAVGGVVLGEHLSGGAISGWAEGVPELAAAGDWATGAAADAGEWAGGAAAHVGEAAGDAGEVIGDAAGDAGDWVADAAGDAGDWLGDVGGDAADVIMDLF